jgi:3-phenylpropionate/trans-cinnamate dioxygenase ferredoxin subunit
MPTNLSFVICRLSLLTPPMALQRVCKKSELAPGEVKRIEDPAIAVFNVGGTLFAISDTCTHAEASLSEGRVDGETVECPLHGACFDLRTGEALTPPAVEPVRTFRVLLQEDDIYVEITSEHQW